jgi:hypothetical protein
LKEATKWLDAPAKSSLRGGGDTVADPQANNLEAIPYWERRLEIQILRREAEALIRADQR